MGIGRPACRELLIRGSILVKEPETASNDVLYGSGPRRRAAADPDRRGIVPASAAAAPNARGGTRSLRIAAPCAPPEAGPSAGLAIPPDRHPFQGDKTLADPAQRFEGQPRPSAMRHRIERFFH
jgi:hypothetical protein